MIFCRGIDRFYPGGVEMAYADGVLYDYTDDINAVDTPNFYNMINSDPYLMKAVTEMNSKFTLNFSSRALTAS